MFSSIHSLQYFHVAIIYLIGDSQAAAGSRCNHMWTRKTPVPGPVGSIKYGKKISRCRVSDVNKFTIAKAS